MALLSCDGCDGVGLLERTLSKNVRRPTPFLYVQPVCGIGDPRHRSGWALHEAAKPLSRAQSIPTAQAARQASPGVISHCFSLGFGFVQRPAVQLSME
jgi:hypothetical protein